MRDWNLAPFPKARALPDMLTTLQARAIALPPASASALPWLSELHATSRMAELVLAPWPLAQKRAFLDEQFALQHAHFVKTHRKGDFRLITREDTPIGRFYFNRSGPEWVLIDILLAGEAQGAGIGGALVTRLQQATAAAGADRLRLSVAYNNPRAQALYRRLGFEDAGDVAGTHMSMIWRPIRP